MSDKNIEKSFLYLVLLSVLLHLGTYQLVLLIPSEPVQVPKEVTTVDLKDLPDLPLEPKKSAETKPKPPKPQLAPKPKPVPPRPVPVQAPKLVPVPLPPPAKLPDDVTIPRSLPKAPGGAPKPAQTTERWTGSKERSGRDQKTQSAATVGKTQSPFRTPENGGTAIRRGEGLFKAQKGDTNSLAKLFPSARQMRNLEEDYREKYRSSERGDTRMIDTGDPIVAAFCDRLLRAANESLAMEGVKRNFREQGVGVVKVTINRDGSIDRVEILEPSKSPALDDLVIDAIKKSGYVGQLPRKWDHDQLKVLWVYTSRGMPQPS